MIDKEINDYHKHNGIFRLDCKICFREHEKLRRVNRILKINKELGEKLISIQLEKSTRGECPINHTWCYKCKIYKLNDDFSAYNLKNYGCCTECSSENDIQRNRLLKLKAIDYLGGKCNRCSFLGHYSSYDFHHVNHKEKEFNWNVMRKKII